MKWNSLTRRQIKMNIELASTGGASAPRISVAADEMTTIFSHLQSIVEELQANAVPNIELLKQLDYYTAGKAIKAVEASADANERVLELLDHYNRISTLVIDSLEKMIEADEAIAAQIIARLEG